MATKQCKGCGKHKDVKQFYKNARQDDGLHYYCSDCCKLSRRLESVRKRDKRSRISYRQYYRALQEGVIADSSITLVGVYKQFSGHCAVCEEYVVPGEASMDHKIPMRDGGGHEWCNVQLVHLACNLRKGKSSHEDATRRHKKNLAKGKRGHKYRKSPFTPSNNDQ